MAAVQEGPLERWNLLLERARTIPFYRVRLPPGALSSLDDVQALPFTYKQDLRDAYPFGMFAVPLREVARLHMSSGTTGKPAITGYTLADLELWAECMARVLQAGGVGPGDVLQNAYGYGLFTGGLGFHLGAERAGCTVVPTSSGVTQRQLMLMCDLGTTVLCCTPSYASVLAEAAASVKAAAPSAAAGRLLRGRALERGHARRDRGGPRPGGLRHLRTDRAGRSRCGGGV